MLPTQEHYNNVRLNSVIGYITPKDMLAGHQREIQAKQDRKLEAVRQQRKNRRQRACAHYLRFADDSGVVPLNPLKMKLLSEISASTSAGRRPRVTPH